MGLIKFNNFFFFNITFVTLLCLFMLSCSGLASKKKKKKKRKKNKKYLSFFLSPPWQCHPDNKLSYSKNIYPFDWHFIDKNVLAKVQAVAALKYEKWWTAFCDLYRFSLWWMDITYLISTPQPPPSPHWIIRSVIATALRIPSFCTNNLWKKKKWEKRTWQAKKDRKVPEGPAVVFTWKSLTFIPLRIWLELPEISELCKVDNEVHDEVSLAFFFSSQWDSGVSSLI